MKSICDVPPYKILSLVQIGEQRGFPGMLGSIDCMHWHWEKCPVAWKGMYTRGDQGVPSHSRSSNFT